MSVFAGIDLGTTNTAIATYQDGKTRVWQNTAGGNVTPSAICVRERRGEVARFAGVRAYQELSQSATAEYVIQLFKRFIGSNTKMPVKALNEEWTPEQCSAVILQEIMSYVPQEIRSELEGVVVTVPAAFEQAQKNATLEAAEQAEIGRVTLLQEPVAAVMAATRERTGEGHLLIYDMGGGTLDVAIAEYGRGAITLHTEGGIAMCGGRDWDRTIVEEIVAPWLEERFSMPAKWTDEPRYKGLLWSARFAAERAKIELWNSETATIELEEAYTGAEDAEGQTIYLDVPLSRAQLDGVIEEQVARSIEKCEETIKEAGMEPADMDEIIFIGGPTKYEALREKVAGALGIKGNVGTDPMTAVAEGAAIFAESFNWSTGARQAPARAKHTTGTEELEVEWSYPSRVTGDEAKVRVEGTNVPSGARVTLTSEQTGWTTGAVELKAKTTIGLRIGPPGENTFEVTIEAGGQRQSRKGAIKITKALASIESVPLSSSIGIEVRTGRTGRTKIDWLARKGAELPLTGARQYRADDQVVAGESDSITMSVFSGEHDDPQSCKKVGAMRIQGTDLDEGTIEKGAVLECKYTIGEGGQINFQVTVEGVKQVFDTNRNYYARKVDAIDYREIAGSIQREAAKLREDVERAEDQVEDKGLRRALVLLDEVDELPEGEKDPEVLKEHDERLQEVKNLLARAKKTHRSTLLGVEVREARKYWEQKVVPWAEESTRMRMEKTIHSAEAAAAMGEDECEDYVSDIYRESWETLWKEDWYVQETYKSFRRRAMQGALGPEAHALVRQGDQLLERGDSERLRETVIALIRCQPAAAGEQRWLLAESNIVAG